MWLFGRRAWDPAILLFAVLASPLAACASLPLAIADSGSVVPAVPVVPAEYASSPESVAYYFRESQPNPRLRVLAIHDYIANRIAYDDHALKHGVPMEDADPDWVFEHRKGVCAGYASLFTRIATVADLDVVTVEGRVARGDHAWNAVWLDGAWRFVDVTWDRKPSGEVVHDYFMAQDPSFHGDHVLDRDDREELQTLDLRPSASVAAMPAFVEESMDLVARYLRKSNPDPVDRAIALHDYVAMRIAYDRAADWRMTLDKKDIDPRRVFAERQGDSVAYADLVTALGTAAGLFVLTADGTDSGGKPHSWNLFWLQGGWWSVDVALDWTSSGRLKRDHFLSGEAAFHRQGFDLESLWVRADDGMRRVDARSTHAPQIPCSPEMGLTACTRAHALATTLRLHQDR